MRQDSVQYSIIGFISCFIFRQRTRKVQRNIHSTYSPWKASLCGDISAEVYRGAADEIQGFSVPDEIKNITSRKK